MAVYIIINNQINYKKKKKTEHFWLLRRGATAGGTLLKLKDKIWIRTTRCLVSYDKFILFFSVFGQKKEIKYFQCFLFLFYYIY